MGLVLTPSPLQVPCSHMLLSSDLQLQAAPALQKRIGGKTERVRKYSSLLGTSQSPSLWNTTAGYLPPESPLASRTGSEVNLSSHPTPHWVHPRDIILAEGTCWCLDLVQKCGRVTHWAGKEAAENVECLSLNSEAHQLLSLCTMLSASSASNKLCDSQSVCRMRQLSSLSDGLNWEHALLPTSTPQVPPEPYLVMRVGGEHSSSSFALPRRAVRTWVLMDFCPLGSITYHSGTFLKWEHFDKNLSLNILSRKGPKGKIPFLCPYFHKLRCNNHF